MRTERMASDSHDVFDGPLSAEWEALADRNDASPFSYPGWFSAWCRAFGAGDTHLITLRRSGDLVGLAPLRKRGSCLAALANAHTPLYEWLVEGDNVAEGIAQDLLSELPRRISVTMLDPSDPGSRAIVRSATAQGYRIERRIVAAAPVVRVTGEWKSYEAGLRTKLLSELRRRRRRLHERGTLSLDVYDGTENLERLLREGFRVEGSGWKGDRGTSINSRVATRSFYTEVARWASEKGWLRLAFLRLDDTALAFDYSLERNGIHYLIKTGYEQEFRKFAPGMVMRHMMLERAFERGLSAYEFLGEDYAWKREWSAAQQERMNLELFAPSLGGWLDHLRDRAVERAEDRSRKVIECVFDEAGLERLRRLRARTSRRR